MKILKRILIVGVFVGSSWTWAQMRSFNSCPSTEPSRVELDNLCPRLEGVHLEGCCPPLRKSTPQQCRYHIVRDRGQAYLTQSSYTVCENGANVQVACCGVGYRACFESPVTLNYIPRLIYRAKTCCFENCPSADYWRQAPANPAITASHELTNGGGPAQCTGTILQECSVGSSSDCQPSTPCPVPAPSPNPTVMPTVSPTPMPTVMPTPAPTVVPSPSPSPTVMPPPPPPPPFVPDGA